MNENLASMAAEAMRTHEAKEERQKLRPWVHGAIGAGCALALFVAAIEAYGAEVPVHVWTDGNTTIKLMRGPCVDPAVKPFLESVGELPKFKAVESTWLYKDGRRANHGGCWAEFTAKEAGAPEPVFLMLFDDGEKHIVPKSEFLKKPGTVGV